MDMNIILDTGEDLEDAYLITGASDIPLSVRIDTSYEDTLRHKPYTSTNLHTFSAIRCDIMWR